MRNFARRIALGAAFFGVLMPVTAAAQMRQFTGRIDKVDAKQLVADNRMGDQVLFVKIDDTVVEGEKSSWSALAKKDWVTISWKFVDKPKRAYVVRVLPPKDDDE